MLTVSCFMFHVSNVSFWAVNNITHWGLPVRIVIVSELKESTL